ncbi:hypothetical protein EMN47_06830 [Prolixibacteraceae bacterium JC049]|nr:hypothetical protein [Prolixibacteraceae bacterium JC049]
MKMKRGWLLILMMGWFMLGHSQNSVSKAKHPAELNFELTNQYRNSTLEPTWPIYKRNFQNEPLTGALPRFENLFPSEKMVLSRSKNGLKLSSENISSKQIFKTFPRIQAPCVLTKMEVSDYSLEHAVTIGFAKDEANSALLTKTSDGFHFELKQKGKEFINKTFEVVSTGKSPYTLYFLLGNDDFRFLIKTESGLQHIGIVSVKRTCFTKQDEFKGFSAALGADLKENQSVTISDFSAGYFEGIGHADIRSVTYEDGEPIRNANGNLYISTSARFMGKNGGSGGICVYEMDCNGRIVRPVSLIVAQNKEWIEAGTAAKLVFDRETKQWLYVARAFPSPGGMLQIGKTSENLLADGMHLINCEKYDGIVGNSLDGDLIKIKNTWYIAYHGGRPRKLHIAKSKDLKSWKEISVNTTGEGIAIAKMHGQYFIVDATSPSQMDVRKLFQPSEVLGSLNLQPSPGNHRKHGGFPWGCIIPVKNGNEIYYLMVCFSMDEYIEKDSGGIFTYGDIFSYKSTY